MNNLRHKLKFSFFFIILCLIVFLTVSLAGCSHKSSKSTKNEQDKSASTKNEQDTSTSTKIEKGKKTSNRKISMMGRSVMGGWFEHWGYDYSEPVKRNNFILDYKELNTPPSIVDSVSNYLDESDDYAAVFFKFCFEDFEGGSRTDAKNNLAQNKKYVRKVIEDVVEERNMVFIIGNALPKVEEETDSDLVWNHEQFNSWLDTQAKKYDGKVFIFDQYSLLADSDGNLKSNYALDEYDSHLKEVAYEALDESYFSLLEENLE